ncbi:MAG: 30S ribosomal protein S17 [Candidatus Aenigmarchaeota archaeon]|nr:30S ribosomal protein S17 [Candidatus Aenigmarchaeota archaeon]
MSKKKMRNIGLDVKTPKETCKSKKCPFHGNLPVRGRVFKGVVISDKSKNTVVIQWNYFNFMPKYERYERKNTKILAHNPSCINVKKGDVVTIAECRPISKKKSFVVIEKGGAEK